MVALQVYPWLPNACTYFTVVKPWQGFQHCPTLFVVSRIFMACSHEDPQFILSEEKDADARGKTSIYDSTRACTCLSTSISASHLLVVIDV